MYDLDAIIAHANRILCILQIFTKYANISTKDVSFLAETSIENVFIIYQKLIDMLENFENDFS